MVVEDTSLHMIALGGLPGPLVKWFLATLGSTGLFELAQKYNEYRAEAKTIVGHLSATWEILLFEGVVPGEIVQPRGTAGHGWDCIFRPSGHELTFAEMSPQEKNAISMRRHCFQQLKEALSCRGHSSTV